MNKKDPEKVKDYTIVLRLTEKEKEMANELRQLYSVNISNLMRLTIEDYYEKMIGGK